MIGSEHPGETYLAPVPIHAHKLLLAALTRRRYAGLGGRGAAPR